ncbi:MAG: GyrI-like domain-containing protein [Candidatus Ozemobacteraceae bacterium]
MPIDPENTRQEYVSRVNKVVDRIQNGFDTDLSLAALAEEAGFSPFHFHRVFAGVVGEPLHSFVRRSRLEHAALDLERRPDRSITEIALEFGFSSSANFSRAFKEAFGASAREFREARSHYPEEARKLLKHINAEILRSAEQTQRRLTAAGKNTDRTEPLVAIETFPPTVVAYVRHYGPYEERQKAALFRKIRRWAETALHGHSLTYLGICYGDRGLLDSDRRRYDACVILPVEIPLEPPVAKLEIAGGQIAVFRCETSSLLVCSAWNNLHRDWLPGSGYTPDNRPCIERFPDGCPESGRSFRLEICQSIRR